MVACVMKTKQTNYARVASAISGTKQYSQLRAVVLSQQFTNLLRNFDIRVLARRIRLPVISAVQSRQRSPIVRAGRDHEIGDLFEIKIRGNLVLVHIAGIDIERARQVLEVSCTQFHRIPEAVRVADLIARHTSK